ncbi:MFS transporter [Paraburkholderia sp. MMS20-SJTR3]|uniref:MFS transporter n=1 Tax=Paraburkholderia sejongensis TaxID=2886946 RepID=A0ABS8K1F8_9BURK|nr:MFS transporter [Paraburkholderia sp. MMS20-SJTR3]MCC8395954.1 MFS transporter [Paraburkholderia sp. MMS20-SJTR3]
MQPFNALFVILGTLLTASGYGATFLLSMHFRSIGGTDLDTGTALAEAVIGTFVSFPLVDWFAPRIGAARLSALGALCLGAGIAAFTVTLPASAGGIVPGFLVGFGWGAFSLAAPMALAERTTQSDRGVWFMRFGTVQMVGIGACPALAALAIRSLHWTVGAVLLIVAGLCMIASLLLELFARFSPRANSHPQKPWVFNTGAVVRTRAAYSIAMIALCACVFSGLLTFQMSLVQGTASHAGTFFSFYTVTVIVARWLLGRLVISSPRGLTTKLVLVLMVLGVAAMFAVPYHTMFHPVSAVLFGTGYGLAYPVIQEQTVNDSDALHRHAALTWFIVAYSLGAFGFPAVGGWVLVHMGRGALIALIAVCALAALLLSILRDRRNLAAAFSR